MHRVVVKLTRRGVGIVALGCGLIVVGNHAAFAVDLPFSPDCRQHAAIDVEAPNTGIIFRKNPNSPVTRAATATVFSIEGLANITIPTGGASCFHAATGTDNYCFLARSSEDIHNINAVPSNNHLNAPACQ
jgi:hypothetical protein